MVRFLFVCLVISSSSAWASVTLALKSCKQEIKEAQEKIQSIKKNTHKDALQDQLLVLNQWYGKQANSHITLAGAEGAQEKLNAFSASCQVMTDALDKKIEGFQDKVVKPQREVLVKVEGHKGAESTNVSRKLIDQKKGDYERHTSEPRRSSAIKKRSKSSWAFNLRHRIQSNSRARVHSR